MKVYLVEGEHPWVPGIVKRVVKDRKEADEIATELVTIICKSMDVPPPELPEEKYWNAAFWDCADKWCEENYAFPDDFDEISYVNVTEFDLGDE